MSFEQPCRAVGALDGFSVDVLPVDLQGPSNVASAQAGHAMTFTSNRMPSALSMHMIRISYPHLPVSTSVGGSSSCLDAARFTPGLREEYDSCCCDIVIARRYTSQLIWPIIHTCKFGRILTGCGHGHSLRRFSADLLTSATATVCFSQRGNAQAHVGASQHETD